MESLGNLFNKYGSDKDRNGYTPYYDSLFKTLRHREITLLEIGIGTMIPGVISSMVGFSLPGYKPGGSLRAWRDYFSRGLVSGVDIQLDTQFTEERIKTHLGNSTDKNALDKVLRDEKFDIIIDDGCHMAINQLHTLKNLWSRVKPGGYYIIEDLNPWNSIVTTHRVYVQEFIGPDATLFFSENKNLGIISRIIANDD